MGIKNGTLTWSSLVGKEKHNVQKPSTEVITDKNGNS